MKFIYWLGGVFAIMSFFASGRYISSHNPMDLVVSLGFILLGYVLQMSDDTIKTSEENK